MGLPIWQTRSGDLGTIAEREFYRFGFEVEDTEAAETPLITFELVAGELPSGISLKSNGVIEGVAGKRSVLVQGVPLDVGASQTSKFAIRARTSSGRVSDRTFSLTVTGQDAPVITTAAENLGDYVAGGYFEYQLEAEDLDPGDTLTWTLQSGQLPPGLSFSDQGLLRGYLEPYEQIEPGVEPGWDMTRLDMYPWDFVGVVINRSYQFTVSVTDGKDYDMRTYVINIVAKESLTADTTEISSDTDLISADVNNKYVPVLLYPPTDLGEVLHDNYYAYRFLARDWDGDDIRFITFTDEGSGFDETPWDEELYSPGDFFLPPGLQIDPVTGWLYGRLSLQTQARQEYTFGLQVVKAADPTFASVPHYVKITVITDLARQLGWITPEDLGSIDNGAASELRIEALNPLGTELTYRLKTGATGRLPQGLRLLEDGFIIGRAGFGSFFLDGNTTSFDGFSTTFDSTYTFTVNVTDSSGVIDTDRTFTVRVRGTNRRPYENLYLVSRTLESDRVAVNNLLARQDIFPEADIYRPQDPYYGVSTDLRLLLGYGLEPAPAETYINAMYEDGITVDANDITMDTTSVTADASVGTPNHQTKNLRFGGVKHARALAADGTVRYEVVYVDIVDPLENISNVSVAPSITTSTGIELYPNSLVNMQSAMHRGVGQSNPDVLPDWMTSKQADGTITNFVGGCILAYVVPGRGEKIAFNLQRYINQGNFDFKDIKFDVDRYVWDSNMSRNYDKENDRFESSPETTFDASSPTIDETHFDGKDTRFFEFVDVYEPPDENDKYLKFPTIGAL